MNLETAQNENPKGYLQVGEIVSFEDYDGNGYLNDLNKHQNVFISGKINGTGKDQSISDMKLSEFESYVSRAFVQNLIHVVSLKRPFGIIFALVFSEIGFERLYSEDGEDFLRIQQFRWSDIKENCMQL